FPVGIEPAAASHDRSPAGDMAPKRPRRPVGDRQKSPLHPPPQRRFPTPASSGLLGLAAGVPGGRVTVPARANTCAGERPLADRRGNDGLEWGRRLRETTCPTNGQGES